VAQSGAGGTGGTAGWRTARAQHAPDPVQPFVLDQRQCRLRVGQVQLLLALPARAPRAHLHAVLEQVAQVLGAVRVALADERHVKPTRLRQRPVHGRVRRELNAQRPGADRRERRQGRTFGHDTRVEVGRNVAHQVELVDVVARKLTVGTPDFFSSSIVSG
jgi:hypothetical protein